MCVYLSSLFFKCVFVFQSLNQKIKIKTNPMTQNMQKYWNKSDQTVNSKTKGEKEETK